MKKQNGSSEKVSINFTPMELGQIDALVEQGHYADRSDLIRTAVRTELNEHNTDLEFILNQSLTEELLLADTDGVITMMGVMALDKAQLEAYCKKDIRLIIKVIGLLVIEKDVPPELAEKAIEKVKVWGKIRASDEVKQALGVK